MEAVGDAPLGSQINHLVHHIARPCHAETHVTCTVKNHVGSLDKVFGAFLHRQSAEESDDFFLSLMVRTRYFGNLLLQRIDGIVYREDLTRVLVILVDDGLAGQF